MEDMFVRKVKKSGGIISVRICESHRIKGKGIFQKNIKIVGQSGSRANCCFGECSKRNDTVHAEKKSSPPKEGGLPL